MFEEKVRRSLWWKLRVPGGKQLGGEKTGVKRRPVCGFAKEVR